jgi:hypothetical protein
MRIDESVHFKHIHTPSYIHKVAGHIPARVRMPPPRVGGTWVYKSTYQGAFTIHNVANILQAANGRF